VVRRLLLVALGLAVAAAAALAIFRYPGPAPRSPGVSACASVLIVGLRGNGDAPSAGHGMGDDSWAVAQRVESGLEGRLAVSAIGYPYDPGPPWRFGGHVRTARLGSQLAAAVLLADPPRVGGSAYDDLGGRHDGLLVHVLLGSRGGLGPVQDVVPAALTGRVRSYCLAADPVCAATPANLAGRLRTDVHTTYRFDPGGIADGAAAFALRQLA